MRGLSFFLHEFIIIAVHFFLFLTFGGFAAFATSFARLKSAFLVATGAGGLCRPCHSVAMAAFRLGGVFAPATAVFGGVVFVEVGNFAVQPFAIEVGVAQASATRRPSPLRTSNSE